MGKTKTTPSINSRQLKQDERGLHRAGQSSSFLNTLSTTVPFSQELSLWSSSSSASVLGVGFQPGSFQPGKDEQTFAPGAPTYLPSQHQGKSLNTPHLTPNKHIKKRREQMNQQSFHQQPGPPPWPHLSLRQDS